MATEAHGDLEPGPVGRQAGVDGQRVAGRTDAPEAHHEGLPQPAHGLDMEPLGGRPVAVVKVEEGRDAEGFEGGHEAPGPRQEAGVGRRREGAAVGRAGLVVVEVRHQRARRHLVGHEVVEEQDIGLLDDLRAGDPFAAKEDVSPRRAGRDVCDADGLEAVEAGELLVDARARVVAIDDAVGDVQPVRDLGAGRLISSLGGCPRPRSPRPAPTAAAAARRFQRAITFVKALSSTSSWYSSGPMMPRRWTLPSASRSSREAQKRAVSMSRRRPPPLAKVSSPLQATCSAAAQAMSATTWSSRSPVHTRRGCAVGPVTQGGVTSRPSAADSQGNQAPRRPASRAAAWAAAMRLTR